MERATATRTRARTIQKINDYVIYMVFLLAIGITFYAYSATLHNAKKRHAAEFHLRSEEISSNIHKEIKVYEQVLWSSVAFFNSSEIIRRDEWKEFIDTININKHWPGIQALGYVIPLLPSELQAHEEAMHKEGFIDYKVQPQTPRDFYTSIIFIEPFDWRNQRALVTICGQVHKDNGQCNWQ